MKHIRQELQKVIDECNVFALAGLLKDTPHHLQRALEILTILHHKEVALECVKASNNYKEYAILVRSVYGNVNIAITEQEYNLLKEWLNEFFKYFEVEWVNNEELLEAIKGMRECEDKDMCECEELDNA